MSAESLSPENIMQLTSASWGTAILGAAAEHGFFNHLQTPATAAEVAQRSGVSVRGSQALLDGLLGLGLVSLERGRYRNAPEASAFLVDGKPGSFGGFAKLSLSHLSRWAELAKVVKTGLPSASDTTDVAESPLWEPLVTSIAVLSFPVAQAAAERLSLAKAGSVTWLDVGGGSGVYSAVWLGANRQARAVQLDWPNINRIARGFVGQFGVGDRFRTLDGDFRSTDFGQSLYDYAIFSHIAHQESPETNRGILKKFRRALKPAGTLLINDFILDDERRGHPFSLMFSANMLLHSKEGSSYQKRDYQSWLQEAGFESVTFEPTPGAATLIYAR